MRCDPRQPPPDCRSDDAGVLYVEYLVAILPLLTFFLALVQLGFVAVASLVVQHAATRAVRAAVVVLADDPVHYGGEPRYQIDYHAASPRDAERASELSQLLSTMGGGLGDKAVLEAPAARHHAGGPRLQDIRWAAYVPLAAMAPAPGLVLAWLRNAVTGGSAQSLAAGLGSGESPLLRMIFGLSMYSRAATAVTFPIAPGSDSLREGSVTDQDMLDLRIDYLYHCGVPLVSRWICDSAQHHAETTGALAYAELPDLLLASKNARFKLLRAEASLPVQGARYAAD